MARSSTVRAVRASDWAEMLGMELGVDYELKKKGLSNSPKSLISLMASPRGVIY